MKKIIVWLIIGIVCIIISIILANRMDGSFGLNKESWLTLVIGGLGIFATGVSGINLFRDSMSPFGNLYSELGLSLKIGKKKEKEKGSDENSQGKGSGTNIKQTFVVEKAQKAGNLYFVTLKNSVYSRAENITIENGNTSYYELISSNNVPDVMPYKSFTVDLKKFAFGSDDDIKIIIGFDNNKGNGQKDVVILPEKEVK